MNTPPPIEIATVTDLLEALRVAPTERYVFSCGEEWFAAAVAIEGTTSRHHERLAYVVAGSSAHDLLRLAREADGNGWIEGGDPLLWAQLPIRCARNRSSVWVLPEHPDAPLEFRK